MYRTVLSEAPHLRTCTCPHRLGSEWYNTMYSLHNIFGFLALRKGRRSHGTLPFTILLCAWDLSVPTHTHTRTHTHTHARTRTHTHTHTMAAAYPIVLGEVGVAGSEDHDVFPPPNVNQRLEYGISSWLVPVWGRVNQRLNDACEGVCVCMCVCMCVCVCVCRGELTNNHSQNWEQICVISLSHPPLILQSPSRTVKP